MVYNKVVFASKNKSKYNEMVVLFNEAPVELVFAPNLMDIDVEECGNSYSENALLKASIWAKVLGMPALADDSGLEVDSLGKSPGVYSSRVAEDDESRIAWVLNNMIGMKDRKARFVASLALVLPRMNQAWLVSGFCYGQIALSGRGAEGFGYDPIFIPKGYDKTFAELGHGIKNRVSHRSVAVRALCDMLNARSVLK